MLNEIKVGAKLLVASSVNQHNTALAMGSGSLEVFATPALCALMEKAASNLLEGMLPVEQTSVGTALNIAHTAASPVGIKVWAEAEITAVDGRKVSFKLLAKDEVGEIGSGTHERFLVAKDKFQMKANAKLPQ